MRPVRAVGDTKDHVAVANQGEQLSAAFWQDAPNSGRPTLTLREEVSAIRARGDVVDPGAVADQGEHLLADGHIHDMDIPVVLLAVNV